MVLGTETVTASLSAVRLTERCLVDARAMVIEELALALREEAGTE